MAIEYGTVEDYKGSVETANLIPLVGTSYSEVEELTEILHLLENWQYKSALIELDKLISSGQKTIDSLLLKGEIVSLFDYNQEAIHLFDTVLTMDSSNVYAMVMRLIQLIIIKEEAVEIDRSLNALRLNAPDLYDYFKETLDFINENKLRFECDANIKPIDLICVFGYFLNADGSMPPKLKQRLDKVISLAKEYPSATILISGGAVQNAYVEALEMKRVLLEAGIPEDRLVALTRARDTVGNIIEFIDYIKDRMFSSICVVTSLDHLPRAWMSLKMGLKNIGYDAEVGAAATEETVGDMQKEIRLSYQTVFRIAGLFEKQDIRKLMMD